MLVLLCGEIYFFYGFFGGIGFGAILIYTARKLEERTPLPPKLSPREREFFRIYSALEYLDKYLDGKGDFLGTKPQNFSQKLREVFTIL